MNQAQKHAEPQVTGAPDRIVLCVGDIPVNTGFSELQEVTWCASSQNKADVEYVRADLAAPPQPYILLEGLAERLLAPRERVRDADGHLVHPALPVCDESTRYDLFLAAFGLEASFVSMECDCEDQALLDRYFDDGDPDCSGWEPSAPAGEGWVLLEIYPTEDGPYALFVRRKAEEKPSRRRAAPPAPVSRAPLSGRWHHGAGFLCSGSLRIAREDFDTNPCEEFKTELLDWVCEALNAAQSAPLTNEGGKGERVSASTQQAEPVVRYCPGCGSIGPVEVKYRDCCPDGDEARMIPQALAEKCHDTFKVSIKAMLADQAANEAAAPQPSAKALTDDEAWTKWDRIRATKEATPKQLIGTFARTILAAEQPSEDKRKEFESSGRLAIDALERVANRDEAPWPARIVRALIARIRELERWKEVVSGYSPKRDLIAQADAAIAKGEGK